MVKLYYSAVGEIGAKIDAEIAPTVLGYLSMRIIEIGPKVYIYCIMYMFLDLLSKKVDIQELIRIPGLSVLNYDYYLFFLAEGKA